jgi:type VI secretion system secreted protein Hcp
MIEEVGMSNVADHFLKIEGIDGESHDATHKGSIELQSWNWYEENLPIYIHGLKPVGKAVMGHFVCTFPYNKASVKLVLANANGDHIKKAALTCRKAGGRQHTFYTMTMHDIMITVCNTLPGGLDYWPLTQIGIAFCWVEWEYREQKSDGSMGPPIKTGWDVKKGQAI